MSTDRIIRSVYVTFNVFYFHLTGIRRWKTKLENSLREKGEKLQDIQQKLQESETELKTKVHVTFVYLP